MKKNRCSLLTLFLIALPITFTSCLNGLGDAPDIEAPTITITSPATLTNQPLTCTVTGTCEDNYGVTKITVYNVTTNAYYNNATISGTSWSTTLQLPQGYQQIRFTAYDANNNSSTYSVKQLTLFVDATAPAGNTWYMSKNGRQTAFITDGTTLDSYDDYNPAQIDYFQNVSMEIHGKISENMSMDTTLLYVYENDKTIIDGVAPDSGSSDRSPVYTITAATLTSKLASLSTGKHYLRFAFNAMDTAGNNSGLIEMGYAIWYPESDIPHNTVGTLTSSAQTTEISAGATTTLTIFDDDTLSTVAYGYISSSSYGSIQGDTVVEKVATLESSSQSTLSSTYGMTFPTIESSASSITPTVTASSTTGVYYLVTLAKDSTGIWGGRIIKTTVIDANNPITVINSPDDNSIPTVSGSSITINGYTLDTNSCKSLYIAWVPESNTAYTTSSQRAEAAQTILAQQKDAGLPAGSSYTDTGTGIKVWSLTLTSAGTYADNTKYHKQTFTKSFALSDFTYNSTKENKAKFFEILTVSNNSNTTYQEFKLRANTTGPVITITYPSTDLLTHSTAEDLTITYSVTGSNGLALAATGLYETTTTSTLSDTNKLTTTQSGSSYSYTQSKSNLSEGQRSFTFYAKDELGNETTEKRTVNFNTIPYLTKLTSSNANATYIAGNSITFSASFSNAVYVTGTPRIAIDSMTNNGSAKTGYATYTSGSGSDTLLFTYTVVSGDLSTGITCLYGSSTESIALNGGTITASSGGSDNAILTGLSDSTCMNGKTIAIDGVAPTIYSVSTLNGSFTTGAKIYAYLTATENVLVNGSPSLILTSGSENVSFTFQSMSGKILTFVHTLTGSETEQTLAYATASCLSTSSLAMITDTAGNTLVAGTASGTTDATIDFTGPSAPTITGITAGSYNTTKTFSITRAETGGTLYYSLDNGLTWAAYTSTVSLTSNGTYSICAYQTDGAGNKGATSSSITVKINGSFPSITETTCSLSDGSYCAGTVLTFKVSFSDTVIASTTGSYLTLWGSKKAYLASKTTGATSLTFTYTVASGDNSNPLAITNIVYSGVTDSFGNTAPTSAVTSISYTSRNGLIVDTTAPTLLSVTPTAGLKTVTTSGLRIASSAGNKITLVFGEKIQKGSSGTLTLKRTEGWSVPPVMSATEFSTYYNALANVTNGSTYQGYLIAGTAGSPTLDSATGQPTGPYMKITHGLDISGTNAVPDTDTKYVLKFTDSIDDTTAGSEVSNIRTALEQAGYAKQELDVSSTSVSIGSDSKTVTVTFPTALVDGRLWELVITEGAFEDIAGNKFAGLSAGTTSSGNNYAFWSDNVAQPVIRVDRYSHGWGAAEPNSSGAITSIGANTLDATGGGTTTQPTGYARVRIDCETPSATVYYKEYLFSRVTTTNTTAAPSFTYVTNETSSSSTPTGSTGSDGCVSYLSACSDIPVATLSASVGTDRSYSTYLIIGDGSLVTSRKDYVAAQGIRTDFTSSSNGYEGVFKTTFIHYKPQNNHTVSYLILQGAMTDGGQATISGFPLHDADSDERFGKEMYVNTTTNTWYWVSYDIISTYIGKGHHGNYAKNSVSGAYGNLTYVYNQAWW